MRPEGWSTLNVINNVYSVPCRRRPILVDRDLLMHDKVYMVPSRPKSKIYNCFIKLSGILHEIGPSLKEISMTLLLLWNFGTKWGAYIEKSQETKLASLSKKWHHSFVQKWLVWDFEGKSWRLWLGIWILYFDRMLNITYRVLGVD